MSNSFHSTVAIAVFFFRAGCRGTPSPVLLRLVVREGGGPIGGVLPRRGLASPSSPSVLKSDVPAAPAPKHHDGQGEPPDPSLAGTACPAAKGLGLGPPSPAPAARLRVSRRRLLCVLGFGGDGESSPGKDRSAGGSLGTSGQSKPIAARGSSCVSSVHAVGFTNKCPSPQSSPGLQGTIGVSVKVVTRCAVELLAAALALGAAKKASIGSKANTSAGCGDDGKSAELQRSGGCAALPG